MNRFKHQLSRRRALAALGLGTGALAFGDLIATRPATADEVDPHQLPLLVVFCFRGGWDTLLSLDPRDHSNSLFTQEGASLQTAYNLVAAKDSTANAFMQATNNTGILTPAGSNIGFGMAMEQIAPLYEDLCVIRGINMGTLSHDTGTQYFLTGKFPRGLRPSGSALGTWWARENPSSFLVPNLALRFATYNEGLDPRASGLYIHGYEDVATVLKPLEPALEPRAELAQALAAFQQRDNCLSHQLELTERISRHRTAYQSALNLSGGDLWSYFDFKANPPANSSVAKLYAAFGVNPASPGSALGSSVGLALIATQAITQGFSQTATVRIANGLDTHHDNWPDDHVKIQRAGWTAVAQFIQYMKDTLDPNGKPFWDRMTVLCTSEFAREPRINQYGGRHHWLYSSALVAGNGIKGNQVIGATSDIDYSGQTIDPKTGALDEKGIYPRPPDVFATLLTAAGMSYDNVSNQSPVLLESLLSS